MQTISNQILTVKVSPKGAELASIFNNETGLEYLWNGDPAFWPKQSPILFPIVGGLRNETYNYKGNSYKMGRHGFMRDFEFELTNKTENSLTFTLTQNEKTLQQYPFNFSFSVTYSINNNVLTCKYDVANTGNEVMYFSCGAHPAFNVPLTNDTEYTDWHLKFSAVENSPKWPISKNGLIEMEPTPFLENTDTLPLSKPLFYGDALIFKNLQSSAITIQSDKSAHGLTLNSAGFSYYGIWAFKDANFVCLEPWFGLNDTEASTGTGELNEKEGILSLGANETWTKFWTAEMF
jgi:galactose mutarotase-like enzyme